jgi:hypothetical protein
MRKKFYQTKEFKALAEQWEKKLAQDGLADIEKCVGSQRMLKQNSANVYRQMEATRREAKEYYYQQLSGCLYFSSFDSEVDRVVMSLKAEGANITEICRELLARGMSRYRRTVRLIIRKYEHKWGIRTWKADQLKYYWKKKTLIQ